MAKVPREKKARSGDATMADASSRSRAPAAGVALGQGARKGRGGAGHRTAPAGDRRGAHGADRNDRTAPHDRPLQGYIDEASSTRITGWVWNPQLPESPIALELVDGNTRLARVMADSYRSDLQQAVIGDGRHAFAVSLGEELLPAARHVLHLRCAETGMEVPGSPVVIERNGSAAAIPALPEPYVAASAVDQLFADRVSPAAEADTLRAGHGMLALFDERDVKCHRTGHAMHRQIAGDLAGVHLPESESRAQKQQANEWQPSATWSQPNGERPRPWRGSEGNNLLREGSTFGSSHGRFS